MDNPFVWGKGGARRTPEQIEKDRQIADALIAQGVDFSPVASWTQGAARVASALTGSIKRGRADRAEAANTAADKGILSSLLAGSSDAGAAVAQTTAASPAAGAVGSDARYTMGNSGRQIAAAPSSPEIYDEFIGTVKQAGLTNPYGLAAVAATGQAESGYSPKNAFGEWSDPSESGQSGQAGGILSWRADRLNNLRKFAEANGDDPARPTPATQAKFFLNEDPALVAKLNSAGSAEEAQSLMNNAWKFAGYNRPGGEAGKRIAAANAFLPQFNDATNATAAIEQQAPIQVASADPSFMPAAAAAIVPPQPAPVEVAANPVPPQGSVERVAAALTPVQQAMQLDPSFDGFSQNSGSPDRGVAVPGVPNGPQMAPQAGAASGINPAIIQALNDPAASPQTQKIAMALLQQQMAKNAPMSQADQLDLQKTQLEIDRLKNPERKPLEVGGVLLDPQTMKPIYDSRRPEEPKAPTLTEIYDPATGRPQKGYINSQTGEFVPVGGVEAAKDQSNGITVNPDGTVQIGGPQKPLTEGQSKDTVYSTRAAGALETLNKFAPALTGRLDRAADFDPTGLARGAQSTEYQLAQQAGDEFLQAILRKDTGAAISPQEQALYGKTYLPQPGDSEELQQQKSISRTRAIEAIKAGMPASAIVAQELAARRVTEDTAKSNGAAKRRKFNPETGMIE
jgi:hypothetical protein